MLGVRSADFICFFDWEDSRLVRAHPRSAAVAREGGAQTNKQTPSPFCSGFRLIEPLTAAAVLPATALSVAVLQRVL